MYTHTLNTRVINSSVECLIICTRQQHSDDFDLSVKSVNMWIYVIEIESVSHEM